MTVAVVFDVDDTLVDFSGATARGLLAHLAASKIPADHIGHVALWRQLEDLHFNAYLRGECSFQEQRRRRARAFCAEFGIPLGASADAADAWVARYLTHCEAAFTLFPDVRPALTMLRSAGIPIAAMSNSNHQYQHQKLSRLGIRADLGALVCCDDVDGVAKPDPRIFHTVCAALDNPPGRTVYIGDRLDTDAMAATAAGLVGVWINRNAVPGPDHVPMITDLRQITELLAEMETATTATKGTA